MDTRILLTVMTIGFSSTPIYHTKVNPLIYFVTYLLYLNMKAEAVPGGRAEKVGQRQSAVPCAGSVRKIRPGSGNGFDASEGQTAGPAVMKGYLPQTQLSVYS